MLLDSEGIDAYDQASRAMLSKQQQQAQLLLGPEHSSCLLLHGSRPLVHLFMMLMAAVACSWPTPQSFSSAGLRAHTAIVLRTACHVVLCPVLQRAQDAVQLLSLAVLLSSTFVFNQMGPIDEAALDRLSLVTQITKHVRVRATGPAAGEAHSSMPCSHASDSSGCDLLASVLS